MRMHAGLARFRSPWDLENVDRVADDIAGIWAHAGPSDLLSDCWCRKHDESWAGSLRFRTRLLLARGPLAERLWTARHSVTLQRRAGSSFCSFASDISMPRLMTPVRAGLSRVEKDRYACTHTSACQTKL